MAGTLALGACSSGEPEQVEVPNTLQGLIEAAQDEGSLSVYGATAPAVLDRVTQAFEDKYGIAVETVRMSSSNLYTRFATEAQAGQPGADAVLPTFGERDASVLTEDELITPLQDAGIPGYPDDYPEESQIPEYGAAAVNYVQNGLAYNSDLVKPGDIPTSWADLADPKWKGQIVAAYPNSSPNTLNLFNFLLDTQGPEFLESLKANEIRFVDGANPAIQAVAAGEASLALPGNAPFILPLKDEGAPIDYQPLTETSGLRIGALIAAKAEHPNAARLFMHYVLSEEGAEMFLGEPGTTSPHDVEGMKNVTPEAPTTAEQEKRILELLGEG